MERGYGNPRFRGGRGGFPRHHGFRGGRNFAQEEETDRESGPVDIQKRLESLITRLGEKSSSALENNIKNLAKVLIGDIGSFKETILSNLLKCATTMPEKISIYSCLAGVLNEENYAFGGEFIEGLRNKLEEALDAGNYSQAELILRVLADSANCNLISLGSIIMQFEAFLEATYEKNVPQSRTDWYAYAVLSAIPWIGEKMSLSKPDDLKKLLGDILNYLTRRKKTHVNALRVIRSDDPLPQEDYLESLWTQVEDLKNRQWHEKHINRPYIALESIISRGQVHNVPQVFPTPHEDENRYPQPRVIFRLFDFTDCPDGTALPPLNSIERFLIEDDLSRIIHSQCDDRRQLANSLVNYPSSPNVPLDYIIIEVMLGQLMQLPKAPHKEIMYGSTILELCKLRQDAILQTLALAISLLYERVEYLNVSSLHRLASWFAYHLSNYEYRWTWEDWGDCLQVEAEHPRAMFVREILQNCIRLSFYSRIAESVPARFKVFLPEEPYLEKKFDVENPETVRGCTQALEVHEAIRDKKEPPMILEIIRNVPKPEHAEDSDFNPLQIDVFVHIIIAGAAKTFTHLFGALSKYSGMIKDLVASEQEQIYFLQSLYDLFKSREYTMIVVTDRLLRMQLIDPGSVVNWIFSPAMASHFTSHHVWEILQITIHRVAALVQKCRSEVEAKSKSTADDAAAGDVVMDETTNDELDEALDRALNQQRSMFLVIFQRFVMTLTDHLEQAASKAKVYESWWWKITIGHLQYILMMNSELIRPYSVTLEKLVFTKEIDKAIVAAFSEFTAMLN